MDYDLLKKIAGDLWRIDNVQYQQCKVLTIAHDNDRSLLHHGKYYSPLMDTIEDDLALRGIRCQSIARIISTVKNPISYGNVVSPEGAFARALIRKRAAALFKPKSSYSYSKPEERIWHHILDATGAGKVLAIMPSRELCVACHKRGIWVADVQHGVMADSHPWYGVRFRGDEPFEWLPDAFLVWDRGSADVVEWAAKKRSDALIYGSRWVSRFVRQAPEDTLVQELLAASAEQLAQLRAKPTILVSLSWGCDNIPNGFMVDGLADVIKATSQRFNWLLRLHPNQLIGFASNESPRFFSYFDKEIKGHATWEWATRSPLPLVLSATDLHLSWSSSVSIEASQMGIRSALLDPQLRAADDRGDYYRYYRAQGMIDLIPEDRATIADWVEANIDSKRPPESFDEYDAQYRTFIDFLVDATPTRHPALGTHPALTLR